VGGVIQLQIVPQNRPRFIDRFGLHQRVGFGMTQPRVLGWLGVVLVCACAASDSRFEPAAAKPPNVLLLCVDDLRPELGAYGVDYIRSPNIDTLASEGRVFTRHYVQAPTCGASRYALLTGTYSEGGASRGNQALVQRAANMAMARISLPEVFRRAGYTTVSIGKVSHHPGGRHGADWDDPGSIEMPGAWSRQNMPSGPWKHPEGAMHALANGQARVRGETPALESFDGDDRSYPDGWIADRAVQELENLARAETPFFLAVGFIRPHLPFGAPARYMRPYADIALPPIPHPQKPEGKTTWHGSGEFFGGYSHAGRDPRKDEEYATRVRKHYAACVSYVDHLVGQVLQRLSDLELENETIVILWGDHGWHLGEHGIWGKHALYEESLRSPLIVRVPGMRLPGAKSAAIVESVDIFPTLCELAGVPVPESLDGRSLAPQLVTPETKGRPAISYRGNAETIRTESYRLIRHGSGGTTMFCELYDHEADPGETRNIAEEEEGRVAYLLQMLGGRLD